MRTVRRSAAAGLLLGAAAVLVAAAAVGAFAGEPGEPDAWQDVLREVREEMEGHSFQGVMVVEWHDGGRRRREAVRVLHAGGVVRIDAGDSVVASAGAAVLGDGREWETLARRSASADRAVASRKYAIEAHDGPLVAGRSTTVHEARHDGVVVERVFVDDGSGIVLRRERLDPDGRVVRAVAFEHVAVDVPMTTPSTTPLPPAPQPVDELDDRLRDPDRAGDGFELLGRWTHVDGTAQLYYSDGVLGVSVFEQRGRLDWDLLPPGEDATVAGVDARVYSLPVGEAVVFERDGVVYTCVGDAPWSELWSVAADVSASRASIWDRMNDTVLAPFRW